MVGNWDRDNIPNELSAFLEPVHKSQGLDPLVSPAASGFTQSEKHMCAVRVPCMSSAASADVVGPCAPRWVSYMQGSCVPDFMGTYGCLASRLFFHAGYLDARFSIRLQWEAPISRQVPQKCGEMRTVETVMIGNFGVLFLRFPLFFSISLSAHSIFPVLPLLFPHCPLRPPFSLISPHFPAFSHQFPTVFPHFFSCPQFSRGHSGTWGFWTRVHKRLVHEVQATHAPFYPSAECFISKPHGV